MIATVDVCPRCERKHEGLEFGLLLIESTTHNAIEDMIVLSHWSMCPTSDQPILAGVVDRYPETVYL